MRPQSPTSLLLTIPLLSGVTTAISFDCNDIVVDGYKYDLSPLGGVHTISHAEEQTDYLINTTYVLNICNRLGKAATRGDLKCGQYKRICGFEHKEALDGSGDSNIPFPIAGLDALGHGTMDPELSRLKKLDSADEGLLLKLAGGEYNKKPASAVIRFECDPDRTGLEGLDTMAEQAESPERRRMARSAHAEADGEGNEGGDGDAESLTFGSFGPADEKSYVLKLTWKTRYACDDYLKDGKNETPSSSGHWGFLTWLIILLFLCIAAYLIFGSWLNYNRYGARGWDLLPHGDTIRDIPYIFQDWLRRVGNTLSGSGSRGGYSAV